MVLLVEKLAYVPPPPPHVSYDVYKQNWDSNRLVSNMDLVARSRTERKVGTSLNLFDSQKVDGRYGLLSNLLLTTLYSSNSCCSFVQSKYIDVLHNQVVSGLGKDDIVFKIRDEQERLLVSMSGIF